MCLFKPLYITLIIRTILTLDMRKYILIAVLLALTVPGYTQIKQDSTKYHYNFFQPCPKDKMRSFEADRPDATESPYTLDAGHFQFETDLFKTNWSTVNGVRTIENTFNEFNLKLGITNSLDIELITATAVYTKIGHVNPIKSSAFFNTLTIRAKQNIWGNDNGQTAFAILPFVNIPTTPNAKITGGVVFPISIALPGEWGFGSQIEFDINDNVLGKGYHINPLVSAAVSHALYRKLDFFVETILQRESELKKYESFLNAGLIFNWSENIKLDTGIYYGLKNSSSKVFFIGLSFRY